MERVLNEIKGEEYNFVKVKDDLISKVKQSIASVKRISELGYEYKDRIPTDKEVQEAEEVFDQIKNLYMTQFAAAIGFLSKYRDIKSNIEQKHGKVISYTDYVVNTKQFVENYNINKLKDLAKRMEDRRYSGRINKSDIQEIWNNITIIEGLLKSKDFIKTKELIDETEKEIENKIDHAIAEIRREEEEEREREEAERRRRREREEEEERARRRREDSYSSSSSSYGGGFGGGGGGGFGGGGGGSFGGGGAGGSW
jgi:uncharacterized membrane protein YgcG